MDDASPTDSPTKFPTSRPPLPASLRPLLGPVTLRRKQITLSTWASSLFSRRCNRFAFTTRCCCSCRGHDEAIEADVVGLSRRSSAQRNKPATLVSYDCLLISANTWGLAWGKSVSRNSNVFVASQGNGSNSGTLDARLVQWSASDRDACPGSGTNLQLFQPLTQKIQGAPSNI